MSFNKPITIKNLPYKNNDEIDEEQCLVDNIKMEIKEFDLVDLLKKYIMLFLMRNPSSIQEVCLQLIENEFYYRKVHHTL